MNPAEDAPGVRVSAGAEKLRDGLSRPKYLEKQAALGTLGVSKEDRNRNKKSLGTVASQKPEEASIVTVSEATGKMGSL